MLSKILIVASVVGLASAACPNACSGHGACGNQEVCQCYDNWGMGGQPGGDCSDLTCPFELAWVDSPNSAGLTHQYKECAGKGTCDRATGECVCMPGYEGKSCKRQTCPNSCSGHGHCANMNQLAFGTVYGDWAFNNGNVMGVVGPKVTTTDHSWDAARSRACVCDAGWSGIDCTNRMCPSGNDAMFVTQYTQTTDYPVQVQEINLIPQVGRTVVSGVATFTCTVASLTLSGGSFNLMIGNGAAVTIPFLSTAAQVQTLLVAGWGAGITVAFAGGGTSVCAVTGAATSVTFVEHASPYAIPTLTADSTNLFATLTNSATGGGTVASTTVVIGTTGLTVGSNVKNTLVSEVQTITCGVADSPGGSIVVKMNTGTKIVPVTLAYNAAVADITTALTAAFGSTVTATGTTLCVASAAATVTTVTFAGRSGMDVALMTVDASLLSDGGGVAALSATADAFVTAGTDGSSTFLSLVGSSFALTFTSRTNQTFTSVPIMLSTAAALQTDVVTALVGLPNKVIDAVTAVATLSAQGVFNVLVSFTGASVQGRQNLLEIDVNPCLSGCTPYVTGLVGTIDLVKSTISESTAASFNTYECGRRGKCDYASGLCTCFAGYTGNACSTITALV